LGGDEFVVMLEDLSKQALEAAEQTEAIGEKSWLPLTSLTQLGNMNIAVHQASAPPCSTTSNQG